MSFFFIIIFFQIYFLGHRLYDEELLPSPIEKLARDCDTSLHKVQLMKASFYVDENAPLGLILRFIVEYYRNIVDFT